jgi:tryptophan synthase alpha subunit
LKIGCEIRQFIDLPIGVGFGISDAQSAAKVAVCSDTVVCCWYR